MVLTASRGLFPYFGARLSLRLCLGYCASPPLGPSELLDLAEGKPTGFELERCTSEVAYCLSRLFDDMNEDKA